MKTLKITDFWNVTPCSVVVHTRFDRTHYFCVQGRIVKQATTQSPAFPCWLLALLFYPWFGDSISVQNVCEILRDYTEPLLWEHEIQKINKGYTLRSQYLICIYKLLLCQNNELGFCYNEIYLLLLVKWLILQYEGYYTGIFWYTFTTFFLRVWVLWEEITAATRGMQSTGFWWWYINIETQSS